MTSSFEKPNTNPSARSIRTTSTSSPSASDSRVVSSSPPNPAPSTTTRIVRLRPLPDRRRYRVGIVVEAQWSGAELGVERLQTLVHLVDEVAHLVGRLVDALAGL